MIAEGSYPYVTGGVSSWIHQIATQMQEHEFIIYTIAAQRSQQGKFKYKLPDNVIEVKETFLDTYLTEEGQWGTRVSLTDANRDNLMRLLGDTGNVEWKELFALLRQDKYARVSDFLQSKDFYDVLQALCLKRYPLVPFTEMFWTVRSMILPLFLIIRENVPQADLYHSVSTGYAGVVGALAKQLHGKPFLLTEHGIYSREREEEIIKADWVKGYFKDLWIQYFYRLSGSAYENADQVTTLFNRNREIEIELGCDADKIRIIPNGVLVERYDGLDRQKPEDQLYLGAIIRVVPIKDIKTMLLSFMLIKEERPDAVFFIMGSYEEDEEYYEECTKLVDSLQLKDVIFTGAVNVLEYIGKMDVLLLTSISEGQPLAILEGMAAAKPYVATNVGSCKELLEGLDDGIGPAGLVVPVMHVEQIARAVLQLANSKKTREEYGRNAYARVSRYYRQEDVIANYRKLYGELGGEANGGDRIRVAQALS
ncbi:glycosyltransferase involved in cell wall biosynthesis [Cohnella sp. SGD-V74]|jgi:Glycosyltransferase|uniref:GT4 family glycosyltransferase PelF n=1 Tax=unclassified Cohnella TaxID=2636738 RepID=UPI000D41180C|nr:MULTISPECIES: GT4 family glycosyltransferase PelF [unclassified Cohnella]PRX59177.1 glycosyltransferase involved in cell wall biosynthesis [Cohnella sp. SGD-V74]